MLLWDIYDFGNGKKYSGIKKYLSSFFEFESAKMEILDIKEILVRVVLLVDRKTLRRLYLRHKKALDDPFILRLLAKQYNVPTETEVFHKGQKRIVTLINSFTDLMFAIELRDPECRLSSCLTWNKMVNIAVYERDLKLLSDLMTAENRKLSDQRLIEVGATGNVEMINFVESKTNHRQRQLLEGLISAHHNELYIFYSRLWNFVAYDQDLRFLNYAAIKHDNLVIFRTLQEFSEHDENVLTYLELAALSNSKQIIQFLGNFNELTDQELARIFESYIDGGHWEEAVSVYDLISCKDEIKYLEGAIISGSVNTLIYAMKVMMELNEKDGSSRQFKDTFISSLASSGIFNESVKYFLLKVDPRWKEEFLRGLMTTENLRGLIDYCLMFKLPKSEAIKLAIEIDNSYNQYNRCFGQWLVNHYDLD